MAATVYLTRFQFGLVSGTSDDRPTIDFVTQWGAAQSMATLGTILTNFLNTTYSGQTLALGAYMSPVISRAAGAVAVTAYDITAHLNGSPFGSPYGISTASVGAAASNATPYPRQVTCTIDYHADLSTLAEFGPGGSTIPTNEAAQEQGAPATHLGRNRYRARARGRVKFGPLNAAAFATQAVTNESVFASEFVTDAQIAMRGFADAQIAAGGPWQIWSRRDALVRPVIGGWIPSIPTTDRRRVIEELAKSFWVI